MLKGGVESFVLGGKLYYSISERIRHNVCESLDVLKRDAVRGFCQFLFVCVCVCPVHADYSQDVCQTHIRGNFCNPLHQRYCTFLVAQLWYSCSIVLHKCVAADTNPLYWSHQDSYLTYMVSRKNNRAYVYSLTITQPHHSDRQSRLRVWYLQDI